MRQAEPDRLPELLTVSDIAELMRVSTRTVHRYRSEGLLCEPILLGGRTPRWRREDITNWIANGCPAAVSDQE